MDSKLLYVIIACIVTSIDFGLAFLVFCKKKQNTGKFGLAVLFTGMAQLFYTISILVTDYMAMKIATGCFFSCIPLMLFFLVSFFFDYLKLRITKGHNFRKRLLICLIGCDIVLELTNPLTEWVMKFRYHPEYELPWVFEPQLLYKLHLGLCYVIILIICIYIIEKFIHTPVVYKAQYYTIVLALLVAVGFNGFCLVTQDNGMPDYSQISYMLLAVIVYWDIFHNTQEFMLNRVRKVMLDELNHPVILFGEGNNVAICNDSVSFLVPKWKPGQNYYLREFLANWGFDPKYEDDTESSSFQWTYLGKKTTVTYRVDFRVIKDKKNRVIGRMFVFTDKSLEIDLLTQFHSKNAYTRYLGNNKDRFLYPAAVAVCDINRLSQINKIYGERMGDSCIEYLAQMMQKHFPENTYFARLSDANLIAVVENTSNEQMHEYLKRVENACEQFDQEGFHLRVQGAVCLTDEEERDILKAGETALFTLKSRKLMDRNSAHSSLLDSFKQTLLESDETTEAHVLRTKKMGELLGERLHFTDKQLSDLSLLCMLHDIGKLGIPNEILNKPMRLTPQEWDVMKEHCVKGYRIAMASPELSGIADYILHHHERWDGKGYPDGLEKESIPLLSRVIAIIDAYDAMVNDRPYHRAMSDGEARAELKRCSGTQFDPYLVSEFLALLESVRPLENLEEEHVDNLAEQAEFGIKEYEEVLERKVFDILYTQYELDENDHIVNIDERFTELTGYEEQDVRAYHLTQWDLVPTEDESDYKHRAGKNIKESGMALLEHRIRRKDGSYRYVFCFGRKKYNTLSKAVHSVIIAFDAETTNAVTVFRELERESVRRGLDKWEELSRKDSLTGILNHAAFVDDVEMKLLESRKRSCLVILDVDNFKQYNDSYGHMIGDVLLEKVANVLESQVAQNGFAGRIGGDEFAAWFAVDETEQAEGLLRQQVKEVFEMLTKEITVLPNPATISLGAAISDEETRSFRGMYQLADQALYHVKERGRNGYEVLEKSVLSK